MAKLTILFFVTGYERRRLCKNVFRNTAYKVFRTLYVMLQVLKAVVREREREIVK